MYSVQKSTNLRGDFLLVDVSDGAELWVCAAVPYTLVYETQRDLKAGTGHLKLGVSKALRTHISVHQVF